MCHANEKYFITYAGLVGLHCYPEQSEMEMQKPVYRMIESGGDPTWELLIVAQTKRGTSF